MGSTFSGYGIWILESYNLYRFPATTVIVVYTGKEGENSSLICIVGKMKIPPREIKIPSPSIVIGV